MGLKRNKKKKRKIRFSSMKIRLSCRKNYWVIREQDREIMPAFAFSWMFLCLSDSVCLRFLSFLIGFTHLAS